jgi:dihydropteroate synthase
MKSEIIKEEDVKEEMEKIGVEKAAVNIMLPKSVFRVVKLYSVRNAIANILKQEMLSVGGEVAVNKGCVNCTIKESDVLIMGTLKQFKLLAKKMKANVSESKDIALEIEKIINKF